MTDIRRLIGLGFLLVLCLTFVACKSDAYVGSWKPVPSGGDDDHMRVETLTFTKEGTFTIKYKDGTRKDVNGTYTKVGDKVELVGPGSRGKVEANVGSDGRLGISEGGGRVAYFAKN